MAVLANLDRKTRYSLLAGLALQAAAVIGLISFFGAREGTGPRQESGPDSWNVALQSVRFDSVEEVERLFARLSYHWPLAEGSLVPRIAIDPLPGDYQPDLEVSRKKALFFRAMLPLALAENGEIRKQREFVKRVRDRAGAPLDARSRERLRLLFGQYRVEMTEDLTAAIDALLQRMDEIPPALLLAQAANESAWGTSRFARLANNLFGQWTWRDGQGIVPLERPEGESYAVRKFPSLRASVRDYIHNLNIGHAYEELRALRSRQRQAGQPLDALALAAGLTRYSQRGEAYVDEIRSIIRGNRLEVLADVGLAPPGAQVAVSGGDPVRSTGG